MIDRGQQKLSRREKKIKAKLIVFESTILPNDRTKTVNDLTSDEEKGQRKKKKKKKKNVIEFRL